MLVPRIFSNNFAEDMFDDFFNFGRGAVSQTPSMNVDVKEFDDKYELDVELPGYNKEDIQAELKDGYLVISANHDETNEEKDKDGRYIRRERFTGSCKRSFYVGEQVKQEDIRAGFENGILKMTVPKVAKQPEIEERKYIAIE